MHSSPCSPRFGQSALTHLMVSHPPEFPHEAELESGSFDFFQLVGISEGEAAFARKHDGSALLQRLLARRIFPVTNPDRPELEMESE
ncbi:MAG: suppressor of fused domain protein [Planctomycetales bacterium]